MKIEQEGNLDQINVKTRLLFLIEGQRTEILSMNVCNNFDMKKTFLLKLFLRRMFLMDSWNLGNKKGNATTRTIFVVRDGNAIDVPLWGPNYEHDSEGAIQWYGFGGPHPGICNFVMGDGAVHSIAITTPVVTLKRLACVNDGENVTIP